MRVAVAEFLKAQPHPDQVGEAAYRLLYDYLIELGEDNDDFDLLLLELANVAAGAQMLMGRLVAFRDGKVLSEMPAEPVVVVEVSGGVVQEARANAPVDIVIVDWDNINAGDDMPALPAGVEARDGALVFDTTVWRWRA